MLFATLTNEIKLPAEQALLLNVIGLCLLFTGIFVYRRMLRTVGIRGGLVRSDLFGLPDSLVAGMLVVLLVLLVAMQWVMPTPVKPPDATGAPGGVTGLQIIYGALQFALPVAGILAFLISRGLSVPLLFGLGRVGPLRAIGTGAGLVALLLPMFLLVSAIMYQVLDGHAEQQDLVKVYQRAAKDGQSGILWQVLVAAVVIAPISEEFLFRGYFYPVLKRVAGPLPAALGVSVLFAAIHNNALGFPGLALLALALTLAYEWTGSLLVPVFMHACFNATSLVFMWWATNHGMAQ